MEIYHLYAGISAFGYAIAALFTKQAIGEGAGLLRVSFWINWMMALIFAVPLLRSGISIDFATVGYPLANGALFFLGQSFTFAAIRFGDVSLQTPIMGTKAVFAVLLALLFGTEAIRLEVGFAAIFAMLGVALLSFSGGSYEKVGKTICFALLSSIFFAGSDVGIGEFAQDYNTSEYIFLVILTNALLSFLFFPFFKGRVTSINTPARLWLLGAGILMGGQALLLNYTIGQYQNVAAINVIYTSRGLWSVLLAMGIVFFVGGKTGLIENRRLFVLRLLGALLMCVAIFILFLPGN